MKRLLILCFSMLLSFAVFSQTQQTYGTFEKPKASLATLLAKGHLHWRSIDAFTKQAVLNKTTAVKARLDSVLGLEEHSIFLYNAQNQLIEAAWYGTDSIVWEPKWRETFTYQNNMLYEDISAEWDNNQWVIHWKDVFYYDANNRIDYILAYSWDAGQSQWVAEEKSEYSYNAQNLIEEIVDYSWQGAWQKTNKTWFDYSPTNKISQELRAYWTGNDWESSYKMEYSYDANDLLEEMKAYTYQPWNMQWVNSMKIAYFYTNNLKYQEILYSWNSTTTSYVPIEKMEYNYNATNDIEVMIRSFYDGTVWIWETKEISTFDLQFAFSDLIIPFVIDEPDLQRYFSHKIDKLEIFQFQGSTWQSSDELDLYYTTVNVFGIDEQTQEPVTLYPNPTTDWLVVVPASSTENYTFEIYDINGRSVLRTSARDRIRLNLCELANGMYFWRLHQQNGQGGQHGKLIKN